MPTPLASLLPALAEAGEQASRAPLRLAAGIVDGGERGVRAVGHGAVNAAGDLMGRLLDSTMRLALDGRVVDRVLERVQESGVAERILQRLLEDGTAEQIVARLTAGPELGRMLAVAIESEQTQQALAQSLESEATLRLVQRLTESPGSDRILAAVLASPMLEEVVSGLLESEQLWILVDEVAQSPAVTAAITQQGRGFVEEVAERARAQSRSADAWLERVARRRRRHTPSDGANPPVPTSLPETSSR